VIGLLSAFVICCTGGIVLTRSSNEQEIDGSISSGHKFRPVSILHSVPQHSSIPLHTIHTCARKDSYEKKQIFDRKTPKIASRKQKNANSLASSSDCVSGRKMRKQTRPNSYKKTNSSSLKNQKTAKNAENQPKKTFNTSTNHLQGLVRSNSGTWKHYL